MARCNFAATLQRFKSLDGLSRAGGSGIIVKIPPGAVPRLKILFGIPDPAFFMGKELQSIVLIYESADINRPGYLWSATGAIRNRCHGAECSDSSDNGPCEDIHDACLGVCESVIRMRDV